jgi:hypothetical protein
MSKHQLHIAHQVPGRVRMKIPAAKGDVEMLREISETFGKIPGVEQVTVNPTTGSIVLQYDADRHDEFHGELRDHCERHAIEQHRPPATEIDELAHKIEDQAEFLAEHSASARMVVDFVKRVDREIKLATNNNIDLKIVLAAGIVGFTVLEVGTSAATPVWVTLSLFGINHFIEMHPAHSKAGRAAAPAIVAAP